MGCEQEIFNREQLLVGEDVMQSIFSKRVIIFGVGGVGSWCAESLVRSGISKLTIVDSDRVCLSNVNRQLMATTKTVGCVKVDVLKERLLEINPAAEIQAIQDIYDESTAESFHLETYDYIIDAIDSLKDKAHLILEATRTDAVFVSSMGAALKMDPMKIQVAEFWKVRGCPLGAALRKRFKRDKIYPSKKFKCVFSEELLKNRGGNQDGSRSAESFPTAEQGPGRPDLLNHDWNASKAQINGTVAHTTAIFGFILAGLVIQDVYYNKVLEA